jgi:hypothetical protein
VYGNEFGTRATAGRSLLVVAGSCVMMTISHGVAVTSLRRKNSVADIASAVHGRNGCTFYERFAGYVAIK